MKRSSLLVLAAATYRASAFTTTSPMIHNCKSYTKYTSQLNMVDDTKNKAAKMVKGEELETMLQEWEQPLVVDAYATW